MWKPILLIVIAAVVDLRGISFKKNKKEVIIYLVLCLITIGLAFYHNDPNHITILEFVLNL